LAVGVGTADAVGAEPPVGVCIGALVPDGPGAAGAGPFAVAVGVDT
jgi:hypothetical protein